MFNVFCLFAFLRGIGVLLFSFFYHTVARGILVPLPEIGLVPPGVEAQSLN